MTPRASIRPFLFERLGNFGSEIAAHYERK